MVVEACSKTDAGWTFKAWRRGLGDDCEVMRLALRFQDDMGLNKAMAAQIAGLYDSVSDAKASIVDLTKIAVLYTVPERRALAQAAERWRPLCRSAVEVLKAADGEVSRRLPALYAEDSRALVAFLEEAARGDTRRVSALGESVSAGIAATPADAENFVTRFVPGDPAARPGVGRDRGRVPQRSWLDVQPAGARG